MALVVGALVPLATYAQGPDLRPTDADGRARLAQESYLYAMPRCSGLTPLELGKAKIVFDDQYAREHDIVTGVQWVGSYEARAREFGALFGCPPPVDNGALTFSYRIYVPPYQRLYRLLEGLP